MVNADTCGDKDSVESRDANESISKKVENVCSERRRVTDELILRVEGIKEECGQGYC